VVKTPKPIRCAVIPPEIDKAPLPNLSLRVYVSGQPEVRVSASTRKTTEYSEQRFAAGVLVHLTLKDAEQLDAGARTAYFVVYAGRRLLSLPSWKPGQRMYAPFPGRQLELQKTSNPEVFTLVRFIEETCVAVQPPASPPPQK
jgi:hypothetical protein